MKNLSFLFTILFLIQFSLSAQGWHPEVVLVSTGDDAYYPDIDVFENNIHVVWQDFRDISQVYYKRSTDHGLNWNPGERLSFDSWASWLPNIAAMHSNVHVAWSDKRLPGAFGDEIYYRRSTNNGDWFDPAVRLTNIFSQKHLPDIAVFYDNIHIVWWDDRSGGSDIYYIHSTDNGLTWSPEFLISNPAYSDLIPKISNSGNNVYVIWHSKRDGPNEVYFRRSTDYGNTWDPEQKLTSSNTNIGAYTGDITSFDNNIHIAWVDTRTSPNGEIFYIRSTNYGVDWSPETRLTILNATAVFYPSITSYQEKVHITFSDLRNPDYEVYYLRSMDNGDNWEAEELLSSLPDFSQYSRVSAFEGNVFVVWRDKPLGAAEIIFRRYTSPAPVNNEINPPTEFGLDQNYPNPFNPTTTIKYQIPELSFVTLKLYDVLGSEIAILVNEEKSAGEYEVEFNATRLSSGVYFYQLKAGSFVETKKMVLMK